jgi:hypothetical protein
MSNFTFLRRLFPLDAPPDLQRPPAATPRDILPLPGEICDIPAVKLPGSFPHFLLLPVVVLRSCACWANPNLSSRFALPPPLPLLSPPSLSLSLSLPFPSGQDGDDTRIYLSFPRREEPRHCRRVSRSVPQPEAFVVQVDHLPSYGRRSLRFPFSCKFPSSRLPLLCAANSPASYRDYGTL